jgi:hypothetical protein
MRKEYKGWFIHKPLGTNFHQNICLSKENRGRSIPEEIWMEVDIIHI